MIDSKELIALSVEEKLDLVDLIWDSIADEANALPVPPSQLEVLKQRLAEFNANPQCGATWEGVRNSIESQL